MGNFFLTTLMIISAAQIANAQSIENFDQIRASLGLSRLLNRLPSGRTVKVAILDKGFDGVQREIGRTLPARTKYSKGPVAAPDDLKSDHGLRMAQIVSALVTDDLARAQRLDLRLYNVFGFTNFRAAITDLIAQKVDLVLYSEVWEYGGNLDGRGFVNAEVDRALDAGILWINAAGNFGRGTYNGAINTEDENWVRLPDQNHALKIVCKAKSGEKCPVKVVLSWNDFKDDAEEGTDKDLDLALTDDFLNVIQTSTLKQSNDRNEQRPGFSKYPREIVAAQLKPGTYFARVKATSENFDRKDKLRITIDGENLEMPSAQTQESLLTPADNPRVLTVGAIDSDRSGRSVRLGKPDILSVSSVKLDDGNEFRGSSNSAAFTAAVAALLKLSGERVSRAWFMTHARTFSWNRGTLSLNLLGFGPAQGTCFIEGQWPAAPAFIKNAMAMGAKLVQTTQGWRLMTPFDPIAMFPDLQRSSLNDMVILSSQGNAVYRRGSVVPGDGIEIFARPLEAGLCNRPETAEGRLLGF